jgi:hypothetical protein
MVDQEAREEILIQEQARAVHAKRILDDALVKEARKRCEDWIIDNFKNTPTRDDEGALYLRDLWKVQARFFLFFEGVINGGKQAEKQLELERRGVTQFLGDVWKSRQSRR